MKVNNEMNVNAAAANKYLDAVGGSITEAQNEMNKMLTDAKADPKNLQPSDPMFGLTYNGHKYNRDGPTQFVATAQAADLQLLRSVYQG